MQPVLTKAQSQGINEKILILDLALNETAEIGTTVISYQPVRYDDKISQGQYKQVQIVYEGEEIAFIRPLA